jgi:hypothetical protein
VDSIDASAFTPADGCGHVRVLATVDESADLFASNGKQGDSYKTTYQARGQGQGLPVNVLGSMPTGSPSPGVRIDGPLHRKYVLLY